MRQFALFAVLLVSGICLASQLPPDIAAYIDSNESYSATDFEANGANYSLVSVSGEYVMLAQLGENPKVITDRAEIGAILASYASANYPTRESAYPSSAEIGILNSYAKNFEQSRGKEATCKLFTGIDRFPCETKQECQTSCFYTPMCADAQTGNPGFTELVLDFSLKTRELDSLVSEMSAGIARLSAGDSAVVSTLASLASASGSAQQTSNSISGNRLFDPQDTFCYPIGYDSDSLSSIRLLSSSLLSRVNLASNPQATASSIYSETVWRQALTDRKEMCAKAESDSGQMLGELSSMFVSNFTELVPRISNLMALRSSILASCSARNFEDANASIEDFKLHEAGARSFVNNLSAEYSNLVSLYVEVSSKLEKIPADRLPEVRESMKLVERELAMVRSLEDILTLRAVLEENKVRVAGYGSGSPGIMLLLLLAAAAALGLLYFAFRKRRKRY
ncbi:MAG: hypothetical protein NT157_00515 [Candidatus Micrarchaeota archaeon]|nr:hypothetical protein [Candidatus Micrarchaeota archaeon]